MAIRTRSVAGLTSFLLVLGGLFSMTPANAASATSATFVTYLQSIGASACGDYCPTPGYTQTGIAVSVSPVEQWTLDVHYPGGCYDIVPECEGSWSLTGGTGDGLSGHWIRWEGCWSLNVTQGKGRFAGDTSPITEQEQFPYLAGSLCDSPDSLNSYLPAGLLTFSLK